MGFASKEAWALLDAKRKYWSKVLSSDAWDTNLNIMFNIFDLFSFYIDFTLSDTLLSSLLSLIFFDIPLNDIIPWNLAWNVELPTGEEFQRGVLIKLEKKDLAKLLTEWLRLSLDFEELFRNIFSSTTKTIQKIFKGKTREYIEKTRPRKAIYGQSRFDESYYDPIAVRDFLRSTFEAWMQKRKSYEEVRRRLTAVSKSLNIVEPVVEDIFNRLSMFDSIKETCLTWDYGWWDRTLWGMEEHYSPTKYLLEFITFDGRKVTVEYTSLFEAQGGGYWDLSFWDMFYWTPPKIDNREVYNVWKEYHDTYVSIFRDALVVNARSRIIPTATAIANYQTYEEMRSPFRSGRLETYGIPYSMRLRLERMTESIVKRFIPNIDVYRLRLYKSAILDLFGALTGQHRWGSEMERSMTDEELKNYWVSKWGSDGLDPNILKVLYDSLISVIKAYGNVRVKDRLRFLRYRLRR